MCDECLVGGGAAEVASSGEDERLGRESSVEVAGSDAAGVVRIAHEMK